MSKRLLICSSSDNKYYLRLKMVRSFIIISPENVRFLASPSDCKGKPVMVDPFGGNEFPDALVNAEVPNPDAVRLQKETCVPQIPVDYVVAVHEG